MSVRTRHELFTATGASTHLAAPKWRAPRPADKHSGWQWMVVSTPPPLTTPQEHALAAAHKPSTRNQAPSCSSRAARATPDARANVCLRRTSPG